MRRLARLRRRCQSVVDGISIPRPFDLERFRGDLAEHRGRPLTLVPLESPTVPGFPSGMWLATSTDDYVFYDARTSGLHQRHIILHEVGHMLFGHDDRQLADNAVLHNAFDAIHPDAIRRLLGRIHYSNVEEQEAEMVATLLLEAIDDVPPRSRFTGALAELERMFGYRTGPGESGRS